MHHALLSVSVEVINLTHTAVYIFCSVNSTAIICRVTARCLVQTGNYCSNELKEDAWPKWPPSQ